MSYCCTQHVADSIVNLFRTLQAVQVKGCNKAIRCCLPMSCGHCKQVHAQYCNSCHEPTGFITCKAQRLFCFCFINKNNDNGFDAFQLLMSYGLLVTSRNSLSLQSHVSAFIVASVFMQGARSYQGIRHDLA